MYILNLKKNYNYYIIIILIIIIIIILTVRWGTHNGHNG